jgi:hypothetical protein
VGQRDWTNSVRRVSSEKCDHSVTSSTVTAGLERIVCEACSHVSLRYRDRGTFWPDSPTELKPPPEPDPVEILVDLTEIPEPKQHRCTACKSEAIFLTPYGVACSKHAWIAASKQDSFDAEVWIPLLIDRSGATSPIDQ